MQLTKRQCWDTLRKMVSNKNNEYRLFLHACFGSNQVDACNHYTSFLRDTFLAKMGLNIRQLKNIAISRGLNISDSWDWIDSLSSEDLLLYYDFQCRALQGLYNMACSVYIYTNSNPYILNEMQVYGRDICEKIGNTNPCAYAFYKGKDEGEKPKAEKLNVTGKPDKEEGEEKINRNDAELQRQALAQVMGRVHYVYAVNHRYKIDDPEIHARFVTSNNCGGEILGVNVRQAILPDNPTMNIHKMREAKPSKKTESLKPSQSELPTNDTSKGRLVGFNEFGIPILITPNGSYFDGLGTPVEVKFDDSGKIVSITELTQPSITELTQPSIPSL